MTAHYLVLQHSVFRLECVGSTHEYLASWVTDTLTDVGHCTLRLGIT